MFACVNLRSSKLFFYGGRRKGDMTLLGSVASLGVSEVRKQLGSVASLNRQRRSV